MLAPLSWLKKYVDIDVDVETLDDMITMTGSEVEGYSYLGKEFDKVVVGKIIGMEKHPDADRLHVCTVDVGAKAPIVIVTGAPNIFLNALVPVALVGAVLPNGMAIKKSKLRGVASFGMMCSGDELNIDDSIYMGASVNGIIIINEDYLCGTNIATVLGMDDTIIDIKTYANRPDCLSMVGTAREIAATFAKTLRFPDTDYTQDERSTADMVSVEVEAPELCLRYMAKIVYDVKIEPSPQWMQKALIAAGVRPINNIVDITNFVMLELGQPMHAFDFKYVKGNKIIVRRAQKAERVTTLDSSEHELDPSMLVICDAEKPVAIAGIMGGEKSAIYNDTDVVLFESAVFLGSNIRATSRIIGLRTESSGRYEKCLDPVSSKVAIDRAMHLVQELNVGKIACGDVDVVNCDIAPKKIVVSVDRINKLLGQNIPANTMDGILHRLQIEAYTDGDAMTCEIPSFRQDLNNDADISEEIMRIYGYDKIPSILPEMHMLSGGRTPTQKLRLLVRGLMASQGLFEAMHYSFMSPKALPSIGIDSDDELMNSIKILNPLGEDYSLMRTTLVPAMINSISNNVSHNVADIKLFEISKTFHPKDGTQMKILPDEITRLCIGLSSKNEDFFTLKGRIEKLLSAMRFKNVEFRSGGYKFFHPGRKAEIFVDDVLIGFLGEIHPSVAEKESFKTRVYIAELNLDLMMEVRSEELVIKALPKYPKIDRDLAILIDENQNVGPLLDDIKKAGGKLLESAEVFDIYKGAQVEEGKKSVAFSLIFRSMERTLKDEEATKRFNKILRLLERNYDAKLR